MIDCLCFDDNNYYIDLSNQGYYIKFYLSVLKWRKKLLVEILEDKLKSVDRFLLLHADMW